MNISIIGYGSMGSMLAKKFAKDPDNTVYVANRDPSKIIDLPSPLLGCRDNYEAAEKADLLFICVGPYQIREAIESIAPCIREDTLLASLNEAVSFEMIAKITDHKCAKVIPNLNGKIDRSETLIAFNEKVLEEDKKKLIGLLDCIGNVHVLPESELAIASDFVGCMPGFIAAIFDIFCQRGEHLSGVNKDEIVSMVLNTLSASSELMLKEGLSFTEVVREVATPGGITMEGTKILYDSFPDIVDRIYEKTLQKGRDTAARVRESFKD